MTPSWTGTPSCWISSGRMTAAGSGHTSGPAPAISLSGSSWWRAGSVSITTALGTGARGTAFDVTPAWNGAGTHIVYARTSLVEQTPDELYVMAADGSGKTRLTRGWRPSWSPDGTRIVFVDSLGTRTTDLYVVAPDGSGRVALTTTSGASEVDPEWSPDNARIAFASDQTGRFEVYVMKMDGSGTIQLTSGATGDRRDPAWAPDGERIAFVGEDGTSRDLYVMAADGSDLRRLTYGGGWEPSWRP